MTSLLDLKNPAPHLIEGGHNAQRSAKYRPAEQTDAGADPGRVF